jgi:hypothetical protein
MISTDDAMLMNPWHHGVKAKRSSPKRDFMEVARGIVEQAIGEKMNRNPHAVALVSMGRQEGR